MEISLHYNFALKALPQFHLQSERERKGSTANDKITELCSGNLIINITGEWLECVVRNELPKVYVDQNNKLCKLHIGAQLNEKASTDIYAIYSE